MHIVKLYKNGEAGEDGAKVEWRRLAYLDTFIESEQIARRDKDVDVRDVDKLVPLRIVMVHTVSASEKGCRQATPELKKK